MASTAPTQHSGLAKSNLDLLVNGSSTANFTVFVGRKRLYIHRHIVKPLFPDFYEHLVSLADSKDRIDLTDKQEHTTVKSLLEFIYTNHYSIEGYRPVDSNLNPAGLLRSHIMANIIGKELHCQPYADVAKADFLALKSGSGFRFHCNPRTDYTDDFYHENNDIILWWMAGAKWILEKGDRLDPVFGSWCVQWLKANIRFVPREHYHLWFALDEQLEPFTVKADLKRLSNGVWENK